MPVLTEPLRKRTPDRTPWAVAVTWLRTPVFAGPEAVASVAGPPRES